MKNNQTNTANIFELFKALQNDSLTQEFAERKFNIKAQTFYKYIKCFKQAGFDVTKTGNSYSINQYAKSVSLDSSDVEFLADINAVSENSLSNTESDKLAKIIEKMLLMTNTDTYKTVKDKFILRRATDGHNNFKDKINLFEKYAKLQTMCEVTVKNKGIMNLKPYKISYKKNKIYFNFADTDNKVKTISADKIIGIQPEISVIVGNPEEKETIFELYGRLAKTYILREEETVVDCFENGIRIANAGKDKAVLFQRLLRYDILCKIIHPESDKIKFKEYIDKSLENINGKL